MKLAQYYNLMDKASREHKVAGFMREYNTRLYAQGVKDGFLLALPINERRAALMDYCRKNMAKYALPKEIEFRTELPKTLVGKVAYRELEEEEARKREQEAK